MAIFILPLKDFGIIIMSHNNFRLSQFSDGGPFACELQTSRIISQICCRSRCRSDGGRQKPSAPGVDRPTRLRAQHAERKTLDCNQTDRENTGL